MADWCGRLEMCVPLLNQLQHRNNFFNMYCEIEQLTIMNVPRHPGEMGGRDSTSLYTNLL